MNEDNGKNYKWREGDNIIDDSQCNLILNLFVCLFFFNNKKLGIGMQSYEQLNQFYSFLMIELIKMNIRTSLLYAVANKNFSIVKL